MNLDDLERKWTDRGFSFAVGTIKSGDGVDEAIHNDKESFMQEGEIEALIPAGSTHSIKNTGSK